MWGHCALLEKMKITNFSYNCDKFFLNGDFVSMDNYVIINDRKEIFRNGALLKVKVDCTFDFPKVKILSSNQFILIDINKPINAIDQRHNAWIINNQGTIEQSFYLGDVNRIIATKKNIICSYSGSEFDTNWKYGQHGLVVFDYNGQSKFEYYRDEPKSKWLIFIENYAFLEKDENAIYYMPYPGFPIVEFHLADFSSKIVCQLPDESELKSNFFWNPKAFSKKGTDWFFITPDRENDNSRIFKMDAQKRIIQIGTCCFSNFPKGLKGGRFFIPFSGGNGKVRKCQLIEL